MTRSQRLGQVTLLMYIGLILFADAAVTVMYAVSRSTERLPTQLVRFALTALLCFFLYRGSRKAKLISMVLFTLGGALALGSLPSVPFPGSVLIALLGGLFLSFAILLLTAPWVNSFLKHQQTARIPPVVNGEAAAINSPLEVTRANGSLASGKKEQ